MADYKLVVLSNAVEGRDDEYNHWYDTQHLDDVLRIPGFYRAERLVLENPLSPEPPTHRYMAIYQFESDDPVRTFAYFLSIANGEEMPISPALDAATAVMHIGRVSGPAVALPAPTPWPA